MIFKNDLQFREKSRQYKVAPPDSAWNKLAIKLDKKRNRKNISGYTLMAVAAVSISIFAVVSVITTTKNKVAEYSAEAYSEHLEPILKINDEGIYEIGKLNSLKTAYDKLSARGNL